MANERYWPDDTKALTDANIQAILEPPDVPPPVAAGQDDEDRRRAIGEIIACLTVNVVPI